MINGRSKGYLKNSSKADLDMKTTLMLNCYMLLLTLAACKSPVASNSFYTLKNKDITVTFTAYGARLVSLIVPDKTGKPTNVVLGFDNDAGYAHSTEPYFGATIGRYCNRIAKGRFTLYGKTYQLMINNGPNTLHGGTHGFQSKTWQAQQPDDHTVIFTYLSKDGEEGFPGNINVKVTFKLTDSDALKIDYEATTDKTTVVNLTNHAFFNLNGEGCGSICGHLLQINADNYTPVDSTLIPTGKIEPVKGTPLDFTKPTAIGVRINDNNEQLKNSTGYDHNFVLNKHSIKTTVAKVIGDKSGILMQVFTDQPGLQFYSGNFMQSKNQMRGYKDDFRTAFALETQHFPDSPNVPDFPSTVLSAGQVYHSTTIYKFSVN